MASFNAEHALPIPAPILATSALTQTLGQILRSYDPESMERATTKFRKPSYQRIRHQTNDWCQAVVESILEGKTIGAMVMSKWHRVADGGVIEEWYNIEDGQTRLDAFKRFKEGEFSTKYGPYSMESIQEIFNAYPVSIVLLEKASSRITNSEYFRALNHNFSDLQEGEPLKTHDRYWAWISDNENGFTGSPLIEYTRDLVTNSHFKTAFSQFLRIDKLDKSNQNSRKQLTALVGIVSGALWGSEYSNEKYFRHVDKLECAISDEEKTAAEHLLQWMFGAIRLAFNTIPKRDNERIGDLFKKQNKFTAAMIEDMREVHMDEPALKERSLKWAHVINSVRTAQHHGTKNWMNTYIFANLTDGQIRNMTPSDIEARRQAVNVWWETNKPN